MPIVGQNFWADAGNFGQGVGQSLGQSMLQLPMERYRLAQQQAQMQNAQQLGMGRLQGLEQLRAVQMQAALARLAEANAQSQHYQGMNQSKTSSTWRVDKATGRLYDESTGKWGDLPPEVQGQQPGSGQGGSTNRALGSPAMSTQQVTSFDKDISDLVISLAYDTRYPGVNSNNPVMFGQGTNFLAHALPYLIRRMGTQPQGLGQTSQQTNLVLQGQGLEQTKNPSLRQRPDGSFDFLEQ